jgi:glycine/D-amino acid oxidase-like deaminating enzyme
MLKKTRVSRLLTDEAYRVVGVVTAAGASMHAEAVVIATGGYAADRTSASLLAETRYCECAYAWC